jgi:predicted peroxiredoxin
MFQKIILMVLLLSFSNFAFAKESNVTKSTTKKKTLSGKKLVVFVSSDNLQQVGMGFGMVLSAVKQGASVTLVLGANAVKYALKEGQQNVYFAKNKTPRALLELALKSGVTIQLCSANTDQMELDEDDFIDGVKLVISTDIFEKVFEEGSKIISF